MGLLMEEVWVTWVRDVVLGVGLLGVACGYIPRLFALCSYVTQIMKMKNSKSISNACAKHEPKYEK